MIARNNNADLYVSLHNNSSTNKEANGACVYVTYRKDLPKYNEGMTILGNKILQNLSQLGIKNGKVRTRKCDHDGDPRKMFYYYDKDVADYYGDIRYAMRGDSTKDYGPDFRDGSGIPTVLIEHCYLSNNYDVRFLDSDLDLKKLAQADAQAIVDYLELKLPSEIVSKITVDKENVNLLVKEQTKVTAKIEPSTVTNNQLKWTTSNSKVVTVDQNGNIDAIATGKATITVTSTLNPKVSKTINVNVEKCNLNLEKNTEYMLANKSTTLKLTATPSWITNKTIKWESDNPEIVTVDNNGTVTSKKAGTANIKVIWKEKKLVDTIKIEVIELPKDTKIDIKNYKVEEQYISKIGEKVTIEDFKKNIMVSDNLEIVIATKEKNQSYIGTNTKVIIKEKQHGLTVQEYECLIYGDLDGNGKITSMDYTLIKNHIMDVQKITNELMKLTADVSADSKITSMDYTLIKNHIMDVQKITVK